MFKSFDKIGADERFGITVSTTEKGLKVETFSAYVDDKEYIYFIPETKDFNKNTDWNANWNESTKYWQILYEYLKSDVVKPYRVIEK